MFQWLIFNSWVKVLYWVLYTALVFTSVILGTLSLLAVTATPIAWCALFVAPLLLALGYYVQQHLMHGKIIGVPTTLSIMPNDFDYLFNPSDTFDSNFINNPTPLAFSFLKRKEVAIAIDSIIDSPNQINQGAYNLCGPSSILYALAYRQPILLKRFVYAFVEDPEKLGLSLPTRAYEEQNTTSVMILIMMALKHEYSITGYHPISTILERIQGASRPKQLVEWIDYFDYYRNSSTTNTKTIEALIIRNSNQQPVSKLHNWLLGGVYSKNHQQFDSPTQLFEVLLNRLDSAIILLLSVNLSLNILGDDESTTFPTLMGIEFTHYVYLNALKYSYNNAMVSMTVTTWGVCATKILSWDTFIEGFCGFIAWDLGPKPFNEPPPAVSNASELRNARKNIYTSLSLEHSLFKPAVKNKSYDNPQQAVMVCA